MSENNKHKLKIVFFPNDCDMISGSSQCMYQLILDLMKMDLVEPYIIFPCKGDAIQLYNDNNIPYEVVRSWDWCTPTNPKNYIFQKTKDIVKFFMNWIAIWKIRRKLRELKPDLVHNNTSWGYVGAIAAYSLKIPVVWQLQEWMYSQGVKIWIPKIGFKYISKASLDVVVSQFLEKKYSEVLYNQNIRVIYDGLDVGQYLCIGRCVFCESIVRILCLGGVCYQKGQDQVIKAIGLLQEKGLDGFELKIVGDGDQKQEFEKLAKDNHLDKTIQFYAKTETPQEFYSNADIVVCASKWEAFGRVTVEAMLAGCLVIASDSGANPEILDNGKYGLMYRYGDIEDLAQKLEYAMIHKEEMREIAKAGQEHAAVYFDSMCNAKEFYEVYRGIIEEYGRVNFGHCASL